MKRFVDWFLRAFAGERYGDCEAAKEWSKEANFDRSPFDDGKYHWLGTGRPSRPTHERPPMPSKPQEPSDLLPEPEEREDFMSLAQKRTSTFPRGKVLYVSTPDRNWVEQQRARWFEYSKATLKDTTNMNNQSPREAADTKSVHPMTAMQVLEAARKIQEQRAKDYDQPNGERSMASTVSVFNTITRREGKRALSVSEGWLLMCCLKLVRERSTDKPHRDSLEDLVNYAALMAEDRLKESSKVSTQEYDPLPDMADTELRARWPKAPDGTIRGYADKSWRYNEKLNKWSPFLEAKPRRPVIIFRKKDLVNHDKMIVLGQSKSQIMAQNLEVGLPSAMPGDMYHTEDSDHYWFKHSTGEWHRAVGDLSADARAWDDR